MRSLIFIFTMFLSFASVVVNAQEYEWTSAKMDGSRTGCKATRDQNVTKSVGVLKDGAYHAPNGTVYASGTATAKIAEIVIKAQPRMAYVKKVVATAPESMKASRPESGLSNLYVDVVMAKVAELTGKKVDVGICNFGGIRAEIPQGDVILDDILSMFPFANNLYYIEMIGKDIRELFSEMAGRNKFEVLGGVRVRADQGKLLSVTVGDEPLDDEKIYSVATISFLYRGGDQVTLSKYAKNVQSLDIMIKDAFLEYVYKLTADGKSLTGSCDGRVVIGKNN